MTGRERLKAILARQSDACGYWHGNPHEDAAEELFRYYGVKNDFELGVKLGSTLRWVYPEELGAWKHPQGKPMFDVLGGQERHSLGQDGVFADTEDAREVEAFAWPRVEHLDFSGVLEEIKKTQGAGQAVFSGMWSCFFHVTSDFFGMENYFVKMHTDPDVVHAVTQKVANFYYAANEILFDLAGDAIDVFFFGNDLGSQLDLLMSPAHYEEFIHPHVVRFVGQAKRRGYAVAHHSCGSIIRIIPRLMDAGVDFIHPIQAGAAHMQAEHLAKEFGDRVLFIGGVDAQGVLPFGTEDELRAEVARLKGIFGPNYILSPSHESILPNIHPEKLRIMAQEAGVL